MPNIKNLIFDLGGVIINIDPALSIKAFKEVGVHDIEAVYDILHNNQLLHKIETGEVTVDELYEAFLHHSAFHIKKGLFIECWNNLLQDIPADRIELLQQLRNKYNIYLLSNTNPIHIKSINQYVKQEFSIELQDLFGKVYLSFEHQMCKPDPAIFRKIVEENDLKYEETLFLDDTSVHLRTAESLGIHTELVSPERSILQIAQDLKL